MNDLSRYEVAFESTQSDVAPGTSVVIPLYNYESLVEETLRSVERQTMEALDLVIVEDVSTDRSLAVASSWLQTHCRRFARATILRNRTNYGLPQTRNNGFDYARTEFCYALDADNILLPSALQKLEAVMVKTDADVVYSQIMTFGDESGVGYAWTFEKERFAVANYVDALALIRKSAWRRAGGYVQLEATGWEDYDLWCTFIDLGMKGVFVPQILAKYRVRESSMLRTESKAEYQALVGHVRFRHPWVKVT